MAAPTLADVLDLSEWIGEPITSEVDTRRAEWALRMASALVRRETKRTWCDEHGDLLAALPDDVQLVTLASAGRGYTNPENFADESLDDWRGRKLDDAVGFALTASERTLLGSYSRSPLGAIGTISTTRGDIGAPERSYVINGPDPTNPWDDGWLL